jgi:putative methionine-R-sulfoxide reductase with GAF domain
MIQRYQSAHAVLLCVKEKLAQAQEAKPAEILHAMVTALAEGRGYRWTGIYFVVEDLSVCQAASGPAPASIDLGGVSSEIVVPIRLGVRTLGLIVAETGRAMAGQERALLQQVAKLVARYLTTNRSKQLLRKTRERIRAEANAERPHKSPQSARPAARKAAAGEIIPR